MKRVWEKIVEGILTCSGFVTSITILLIVVFLFAEALGLFNKKVIAMITAKYITEPLGNYAAGPGRKLGNKTVNTTHND